MSAAPPRRARLLLALALLAGASCGDGARTRDQVLLLTIDTLRPDYLGRSGYDRETTPALDGLLADGLYFERAITPIPRTTQALASMLTGSYPQTTGVRRLFDALDPDVTSVGELAQRAGYRTVAVLSNPWLVPERGLDRGFEVYDVSERGRSAEATTRAALGRVEALPPDAPLLLWVHYVDPHVPYRPPLRLARDFDPDYRGLYRDGFGEKGGVGDLAYPRDLGKPRAVYRNDLPAEVNEHVRRLYAAEIRATDDAVGDLLRGLESRFGDVWTVVFGADHGESLGEHDFFYDHGDYVYDASLRIPLALRLPPGDPLRRTGVVRDRVSLIDVAPTLVELLALPASPDGFEGRSLVPLLEGRELAPRILFAESGRSFYPDYVRRRVGFDVAGRFRAALRDDWKLIWTPGQVAEPEYELYDLARDPGETRDRYRPGDPVADELARAVRSFAAGDRAADREPTPEDRRRLRELGYLESPD